MNKNLKFQFGIDVLIGDLSLQQKLQGRRVALLAHPASFHQNHLDQNRCIPYLHSMDALKTKTSIQLTAAFGPQHGMRGEKQDNMMETEDYLDPKYQIPVYSLYGEVRRPTDKMMNSFDVLLVDMQDVGTRIYTFLTTLLYVMEACAKHKKSIWVLDRPNPAGRAIEGSFLRPGWESFVGASRFPMRHGLTLGESALWFKENHQLDVDLQVITMKNYFPQQGPGYGWPTEQVPWVNPSPNAANVNMARCFPGTVLIEGCHLSEGRGTTRPLELFGAPDIDAEKVFYTMQILCAAHAETKHWFDGAWIRPCYFQPTFHKHVGKLCQGLQMHTDFSEYNPKTFKPYRLTCLFLKAIRKLYPSYDIYRNFPYEYETSRLAFDLINGGSEVRQWIDDPQQTTLDLEKHFLADELRWQDEIKKYLLYE
jgi:uncharacterized protein YbbC (DUF1343 family)